ncbi:hypothetical protein D3C87_1653830 [compost metagenome]
MLEPREKMPLAWTSSASSASSSWRASSSSSSSSPLSLSDWSCTDSAREMSALGELAAMERAVVPVLGMPQPVRPTATSSASAM